MFVGPRTEIGSSFAPLVFFCLLFSWTRKQGVFATTLYSHQLALADVGEDPGSLTFDTLIRQRP